MLRPVIIAGGTGTRLWPLSRQAYPKQFLALSKEHSMLQDTILRLEGSDAAAPLIVCNEEHRFLAAEQLRLIGGQSAQIILEPVARNTAPAVALAALTALAMDEDPLLLVLPADHVIADDAAFRQAVAAAVRLAEDGRLVTFGIVASQPETGYGYIERGAPLAEGFAIARFIEKPDLHSAQQFVADGRYYWNGGMFVFRASRFLQELETFQPDVLAACKQALAEQTRDMDFMRPAADAFAACPTISIDYAVMERTLAGAVVPLEAGWSDLGSWSSLWEQGTPDAGRNVLHGDVIALDTTETLVHADHRLVATLGIDNLVVVETKDAVLVARRDRVQEVKEIVARLQQAGRGEHASHRVVYRPWGRYDTVDSGDRDLVKRITVNPGARLSVQMHHHRSEHWIVVRGTARVHRGDETIILTENQSTYIPVGETHSLENPGKIPLELIEVQTGTYLGEDDIVRFEDLYGRT